MSIENLRFIERDGEKVLQYAEYIYPHPGKTFGFGRVKKLRWADVPTLTQKNDPLKLYVVTNKDGLLLKVSTEPISDLLLAHHEHFIVKEVLEDA